MMNSKAIDERNEKPFLAVLNGGVPERTPFWLMRQAGRYLPEYRELRTKAGSFLDLVYNPEFATEVTMQPLRRYGMDAAILFSDILVIPHALGQDLSFVQGEGPKLDPVRGEKDLSRLRYDDTVLQPVYETVRGIRNAMADEGMEETALIGFAGAPWTVATYMIEGGSSRDFIHAKGWAYSEPDSFAKLIELITEATIVYLGKQIDAGAEAVQLFDSWAGALDEDQYARWVIAPTEKIVLALHKAYPHIPVIGFPRGSGALYPVYAQQTKVHALGLDSQVPLEMAVALKDICAVQGNLDPVCLLSGGTAMEKRARDILETLGGDRFIFNLGHGVIKETPPIHVEQLTRIIRQF
ncbi:MAG: uroporphyrinogen decarboxylase [Rhodospirillales bacterium]|nr:uroporphyrinogen decarboxylase [Rhodospirillales bacterium]MCB9997006.1 uroporphyrinogen decarboxylase [Rhodospirillales bacterium]